VSARPSIHCWRTGHYHDRSSGTELTVVAASCPVATVCPAGEVFISEQLLELLSDRQMEAVLAHEVAHAELGHHVGRVLTERAMAVTFSSSFEILDRALSKGRSKPIRAFSRLGSVSGTIASILATGFGYTQEWEADQTSDLYCLRRFSSAAPLAEAIDLVSVPECTPAARASLWLTHPQVSARIRSARSVKLRDLTGAGTIPLTDSTGRRIGTCRPVSFMVAEEERVVSDTVWVPARQKLPGGPDSVRTYPKRFHPARRQRVLLVMDSLGWNALSQYRSLKLRGERWFPTMEFRRLPYAGADSGLVIAHSLFAPQEPTRRILEVRACDPQRERRSTARR
jgi:Peptidase family M48